jgi:hypothetical protein
MSLTVIGCKSSEKIVAQYQAHFADNCVRNQLALGAFPSDAEARPLCECVGRHITNRYEPEELSKVSEVSGEYVMAERRSVEICKEELKQ